MITGNEAEKLGTGQSNNIIQRGCDNRVSCLLEIPEAYTEVVVSIVLVFLIVWKELWLPFLGISIAVLWLTMRIAQYGNTMVAKRREARRDRMRKADRSIVKIIMSKQEILQANSSIKEVSIIDNELYQWGVVVAVKADKGLILSMDAQKLAFDLLRLGFVCYIAFQIIAGTMTIGDFSLFRGILWAFGANLEKVNETMTNYHQQIIYVTKLRDVFDTTPRIEGYETGDIFFHQQWTIHLDHISFGYGAETLLKDFCLDITGGKKTALVGLSGSGKTTIMKLIAGYLRPEGGQVLVDRQNLTKVSLQSYYRHIGYLTQEPSIFDGTVRENLEYWVESVKSKVESSDLDKIIKLAKCEFIHDFSQGLETEIGEKGIRLSGGQRQRLAIAKIFLKNPEIILLDEPTSALDSFSEEAVTEAMHNLFEGRTVIIIAHRLQTVKHADEIIVLWKVESSTYQENTHEDQRDDGVEVLERGNHRELVKKWWVYAQMVEMQSGF